MIPTFVLLLTATILAFQVTLHAEGQPSSAATVAPPTTATPAATVTPVPTASPSAYEVSPILNASVILQPQYFRGPNFIVRNAVPTYFGSNRYTIDSDFGVFEADGNQMLMRRVAEINAIAELQAMSQTTEFTQAAAQAAEAPLSVAQDLVNNPVPTISSVPRGIWSFLNQAGEAVQQVAEGRQGDATNGSLVENVSGFSKTKRDLAIKLGVDPYSTNEVFQRAEQGRRAGLPGKVHRRSRDGRGRRPGPLSRELDQHSERHLARQEPS
jgi:hypothetical protein